MSTSAGTEQLSRAQYILDRERVAEKAADVHREDGIARIHYEGGRGAYVLCGLDAEWVWSGPASHAFHTHCLGPDNGGVLQALARAVADILRNDPPASTPVHSEWSSVTFWPEDLAPPISAGDTRVLLNGCPPVGPCRILSEENYQIARAAVNALAGHRNSVTGR